MRFFRPVFPAALLYPDALFRLETDKKLLCLTFDDGPDPDSTPAILRILKKNDIRGLFFCDGSKAKAYPELVQLISSDGHLLGNHGFSHLDGCRTSKKDYIDDVFLADRYTSSHLFRPPFGRMKFAQYYVLRKKYRIILWDIMPYDFDSSFGRDKSLSVLIKKTKPGSVICLHDQASSTAVSFLDEYINHVMFLEYKFMI